jgi:hypothetical protein
MTTEALYKALEKRIGGLERALDSLTKEVRAIGVAGMEKQIAELERTLAGVKVMAKNHDSILKTLSAGDDKQALDVAMAELKKLDKRAKEQDAKLDEAVKQAGGGKNHEQVNEFRKDIEKLQKQKEQMRDTVNTLMTAANVTERSIAATLKQQRADIDAMVRRDVVEGRFKILESQVQLALTMAQRR